ncbi:hypothetical protein PTKIN_Ptkin14bG0084800 [Pterospermum kingtungense]
MNVIEIWGYCMDGKHRLLVYEFMEHGSLTKDLSFGSTDWRNRSEIAVGTAKGLACDIKPRNILLIDSSYQPKVSDFGLSWLLKRGDIKHSGFSRIRGTRGYMAPEYVNFQSSYHLQGECYTVTALFCWSWLQGGTLQWEFTQVQMVKGKKSKGH